MNNVKVEFTREKLYEEVWRKTMASLAKEYGLTGLCYQREQLPLFEDERNKAFMVSAMDAVNDKFGDFTVTCGSLLGNKKEKGSHVISPAWKPEGIGNVQVT